MYCCIDSCPSRSDVTSGLRAGFPSHTVKRGRAAARPQHGQMCRYGNNFEVLVRVQVRAEFYTCCGLCTQHCRRNRASAYNPPLYGKKRIMACTCNTCTITAFVRPASRVAYLLVRVPYSSENAGLPAAVLVRVQVLTGTSSRL